MFKSVYQHSLIIWIFLPRKAIWLPYFVLWGKKKQSDSTVTAGHLRNSFPCSDFLSENPVFGLIYLACYGNKNSPCEDRDGFLENPQASIKDYSKHFSSLLTKIHFILFWDIVD